MRAPACRRPAARRRQQPPCCNPAFRELVVIWAWVASYVVFPDRVEPAEMRKPFQGSGSRDPFLAVTYSSLHRSTQTSEGSLGSRASRFEQPRTQPEHVGTRYARAGTGSATVG